MKTLSVVSGVLFFIAFIPYAVAVLRGRAKPAKASWLIWATLDTITLVGLLATDAVNGQIVGAVTGAWAVVFLALKHGTPGWTRLDKFCLVGAVLGIGLWKTFDSPTLGVVTSLSVVFLGSFPTFASAWRDPSREDKLSWTLFWVSCVCAMIAVPQWTLIDAAQPVTFFAVDSIVMMLLFIRPLFVKGARIPMGVRHG